MTRRDPPSDHRRTEDDDEIRWSYVATAPDQLMAEMWLQVVREGSIPCRLAPQDAVSFLGVTPTPVRLMVPEEMMDRARRVLADLIAGATEEAGGAT